MRLRGRDAGGGFRDLLRKWSLEVGGKAAGGAMSDGYKTVGTLSRPHRAGAVSGVPQKPSRRVRQSEHAPLKQRQRLCVGAHEVEPRVHVAQPVAHEGIGVARGVQRRGERRVVHGRVAAVLERDVGLQGLRKGVRERQDIRVDQGHIESHGQQRQDGGDLQRRDSTRVKHRLLLSDPGGGGGWGGCDLIKKQTNANQR